MENIYFTLERKSFGDQQSSEVFDDILFDQKTEKNWFDTAQPKKYCRKRIK